MRLSYTSRRQVPGDAISITKSGALPSRQTSQESRGWRLVTPNTTKMSGATRMSVRFIR